MTPTPSTKRRFLAEPIETTSRSYRRQPSDRSDASPSPSNDSDSTTSSMAVITDTNPSVGLAQFNDAVTHKSHVDHVERSRARDVAMADSDENGNEDAVNDVLDIHKLQLSRASDTTSQHKPRRKFAPDPVETSTRSTRKERSAEAPTVPTTKRKFAPEPIETTIKSSRVTQEQDDKPAHPRRKFNVEPVEVSSSSSKDKVQKTDGLENGARPKRRFAVEPVETTTRSSKEKDEDQITKSRRRFAVEPVETTTRSSKERDEDQNTKSRRRFAVEPVETTTRSSKEKDEDQITKSRRRFAVEPVEITQAPSRRGQQDSDSSNDEKADSNSSRRSSGSRKFSPELIGTAKASYRKTAEGRLALPRWLKEEVEDEGSWSAPEVPESKFSAANLAKRARADPLRHSYCVPDLPMIQSDSSEEEQLGQPTHGAPSQFRSWENIPRVPKHHHSHVHQRHLEALRTLREQAVAAYGQQEDHIPFGHYGGDSDDEDYSRSVGKLSIKDDADPSLFRRMSHNDLHLVMEDMRRHHDQLEQAKKDLEEDTAGISRFSAAALAARHHLNLHHPAGAAYRARHETQKEQHGEEDNELAKMRKAASPPMQGNDIKFPFSVSPKMTRCDPDQAPRPRRANSEDEQEHDIGDPGMWSAHVVPTIKKDTTAGLWGGLCQKDDSRPAVLSTPMRSGIQTPAFETADPLESRTPGRGSKTPRREIRPWNGSAWVPLTPPRSKLEKSNDSFTAALDQKLRLERQIDEEFSARVITQIYNYLSLGYPPIARPFDEELSKISRIPIAELRKDDRSATGTMKGHVGVPEGEGDAEEDDDGRVKGCRRWEALRLYVREWARQSPNFGERGGMKNVGTGMWGNNAPVRKGSWGF